MHKSVNQSTLVKAVKLSGFDRNKSKKLVAAVFKCMTTALCRGEIVPIPGGELVLAKAKHKPSSKVVLNHKLSGKMVYGKKRFSKWPKQILYRPDENLNVELIACNEKP